MVLFYRSRYLRSLAVILKIIRGLLNLIDYSTVNIKMTRRHFLAKEELIFLFRIALTSDHDTVTMYKPLDSSD